MRIISGKYKGKKLNGYNIDGTRPTMDRVKESLFGMIQNKVGESICLDLFAGSGSLGLEALSNGASMSYFVDNNSIAVNTLKKNLKELKCDDGIVIHNDFRKAINDFKNQNIKFDIIFLDPPYKLNLINDCLKLIKDLNILNTDGIIVCEYENEQINCPYFNLIKEKKYGSKFVQIFQN